MNTVHCSILNPDLHTTAIQFINNTNTNVFLTGKAGTGKTTFLKSLSSKTYKNIVVVAPTGIAALNAQGVTIHSQFLLPLGAFIPDRNQSLDAHSLGMFYGPNELTRKHPLNKVRRQVLRDLDVLVIDEVSMLRADVLDAIDHRLRQARRNYNLPFGGAQLLLIGDLYQLPPIVKTMEWDRLRSYYDNIWFFNSIGLKEAGFVYVELEKIYRQSNDEFIGILNNLRNDCVTPEDIKALNRYYKPDTQPNEFSGAITLTTHNAQADEKNDSELKKLKGKKRSFEAHIDGEFPESMYPVDIKIHLKVGAQIMFTKNDSQDQAYFNGKLAKVVQLDDDGIEVLMEDQTETYSLKQAKWENKKYVLNDKTKELEEEVVGSFEQYPIKLAWAITVHKSQGLTFDKAIIDVGSAFAPGQVYVALSRLRSLDGLILRTPIRDSIISSDQNVVSFSSKKETQPDLTSQLEDGKKGFVESEIHSAFNFQPLLDQVYFTKKNVGSSLEFEDETMRNALDSIKSQIENEVGNTEVYRRQLNRLLKGENYEELMSRLKNGCEYYSSLLDKVSDVCFTHMAEVSHFSRTKTYLSLLDELETILTKKLVDVIMIVHDVETILNGESLSKNESRRNTLLRDRIKRFESIEVEVSKSEKIKSLKRKKRTGKKGKAPNIKSVKGETYQVTLDMINDGKSLDEISESRGMALSTIEGHAAKLIKSGDVMINNFMDQETSKEIAKAFSSTKGGIGDVHKALKGKYSFGKLRMVQSIISSEQAT